MMRDYYTSYVSASVEENQKLSDREGANGAEGSFAPFAPSVDYEFRGNSKMDPLTCDVNHYEPGTDTFEERVAIMMYDGGLSEVEAVQVLTRRQ